MISYIQGNIESISGTTIVVSISGIGLTLSVPLSQAFSVGQKIKIWSFMHWNQEQGPSLYGFATELEREVFCMIISCSGIGPKIGLAILGDLGAKQFIQAVQAADHKRLSQVTGIGQKKAEQIMVQLRHKVEKLVSSNKALQQEDPSLVQWNNIVDVLKTLNYSRPEIDRAMQKLRTEPECSSLHFDQLMRKALAFLSKKV